jgi:hypothetical protein
MIRDLKRSGAGHCRTGFEPVVRDRQEACLGVAGEPIPSQLVTASSCRYSTNEYAAPSKPCTFGFVDSMT